MSNTQNNFSVIRRKSREEAFKCIFSMEFNEEYTPAELSFDNEQTEEEFDVKYIKNTVDGIVNNRKKIDEIISSSIKGRDFDRLSKQVIAILRLGVYEICFNKKIPSVSAISEAVKLGDIYCEEAEVAYINGVLNGIYKSRNKDAE
ncbi:MAG: transcription antitermination factor NusB [Anaerofustis stercorihominis]|nr:transcription antitermination factor NusB [Anaerofustis stercorihominis]